MPRFHDVVSGDRLTRISTKYYGVPEKHINIIFANPILKERELNGLIAADGLPIIYAGDRLTIPDEIIEIVNPTVNKKTPDTIDTDIDDIITVVMGLKQFRFFSGFSITSSIGQFDTLSINSPYFDTDEYREAFQPLKFKQAAIYYGENLFFDGVLLAPEADLNEESETLSLSFYPKCGVLLNSTLPISVYPVEYNNLNLKQISENMASSFSIKVEFVGDPGAEFEKVAPAPTEKILSFIIGLAKKRGFQVTNNRQGDLLISKPVESVPVSFVSEGNVPFISCKPSFDPQNYFSSITGLTPETETKSAEMYTWDNPFLTDYVQPVTVDFNDIDPADLRGSVEAMAGRMFGSSGKYALVLNTHKNRDNTLFLGGQTLRAFSPKSFIYNEFNFLIQSVELTRDSDSGDLASFALVIPGALTGELPEAVPWVL